MVEFARRFPRNSILTLPLPNSTQSPLLPGLQLLAKKPVVAIYFVEFLANGLMTN